MQNLRAFLKRHSLLAGLLLMFAFTLYPAILTGAVFLNALRTGQAIAFDAVLLTNLAALAVLVVAGPARLSRTPPLGPLKTTLQGLALPVIGQMRLVPDDCARVDTLAEAFCAAYRSLHTATGIRLTAEQARALARLDRQLAHVRRSPCPPLSTELAMRTSREWQQVRATAREALVHFQWPIEVPPGYCPHLQPNQA